jgi:isopentenyldiphosphate isomerase
MQKEEVTEIRWMQYESWKTLVQENSKTVSPRWNKYEKAFNILDEVIKNL